MHSITGFTLLALAVASGAHASDGSGAQADAPPSDYRSAFQDYRPYRDAPLANWRAVNEEVRRVGGHIGIFGAWAHAAHGAPKATPAQAGQPAIRSAPSAPGAEAHRH